MDYSTALRGELMQLACLHEIELVQRKRLTCKQIKTLACVLVDFHRDNVVSEHSVKQLCHPSSWSDRCVQPIFDSFQEMFDALKGCIWSFVRVRV